MTMPPKIKPEQEVNAYLFYAQRLLNLLISPSMSDSQVDKMALGAAVCLSLRQTWQAWLRELGRYLSEELCEADLPAQRALEHPEWVYLTELYHQENSWLAELYILFEPRLNTPPQQSKDSEDDLRIYAVQLDSQETPLEESLHDVVSSLKTYIQVVRQRQLEW